MQDMPLVMGDKVCLGSDGEPVILGVLRYVDDKSGENFVSVFWNNKVTGAIQSKTVPLKLLERYPEKPQ